MLETIPKDNTFFLNVKSFKPVVSVIIPTFNSEKSLALCLESLRKQSWKNIEVIVVDDNSTDNTLEIALKYNCKIIRNGKKGRAEAKNEGIEHSTGQYLFFIDSDMELGSNTISECIKLANQGSSVGGIVIPERSVGQSFWVEVRDFERTFYSHSIIESARFFPTLLVKEAGGFEEGVVFFEESTLPFKIESSGYVFLRTEPSIYHHEEDFSLGAWLRKKLYYGQTMPQYEDKYGDYSRLQTSIMFRLGLFLRDWRRFRSKPRLAFGLLVLKSLEYIAAATGKVIAKITM